jgi:hypothetical protein
MPPTVRSAAGAPWAWAVLSSARREGAPTWRADGAEATAAVGPEMRMVPRPRPGGNALINPAPDDLPW